MDESGRERVAQLERQLQLQLQGRCASVSSEQHCLTLLSIGPCPSMPTLDESGRECVAQLERQLQLQLQGRCMQLLA